MKKSLLYIAFALSSQLSAQQFMHSDTVRIGEVVISRPREKEESTGYKKSIVDSTLMSIKSHFTLGEILKENTSIYIKNYGPGGISSPSFRGTGAGHTQLTWNGVNISNTMLGQADLSLIPAGVADEIEVSYGGASIEQGNGGIGGTINLGNKALWRKGTSASLSAGAGSFGCYTVQGRLAAGNTRLQSVTRFYASTAENSFQYLNKTGNSEPVLETRQNNQVNQSSFLQEIYYRNGGNTLSGRIWYQSAERNLPGSILVQPGSSRERQEDESFRAMLNYEIDRGRNFWFVTGAWISDKLDYSNAVASVDSRNLSETAVFKAGAEIVTRNDLRFDFRFDEIINIVRSNNYETTATRNTSSFSAQAVRDFGLRLSSSFLVRQLVTGNTFLVPDFSAAISYRLSPEKDYLLKANFSRNSKIPSMNDLFWLPGGNPGLQNEYAFMYELIMEMNHQSDSPFQITYDVSLFRNSIKDMIQWLPGEFSYWTPSNIRKVNTGGLESSARLSYGSGDLSSSLRVSYSFISAKNVSSEEEDDITAGKQLIYVPQNQANAQLHLKYKGVYATWSSNFEGRRFTSVDNSKFLQCCFVNDLTTGSVLSLGTISFDLSLTVNNIFNTDYQSVAYFPMPGRSFFVKLGFNFNKN